VSKVTDMCHMFYRAYSFNPKNSPFYYESAIDEYDSDNE
jgi:hypothetical protein